MRIKIIRKDNNMQKFEDDINTALYQNWELVSIMTWGPHHRLAAVLKGYDELDELED